MLVSPFRVAALAFCGAAFFACGESDPSGTGGSGAGGNGLLTGGTNGTPGDGAGGASGGTGGTAHEPSGERAPDADFTLLFRDDFDTLDTTKWQMMTHSWDTNIALFGDDAVSVADGHMTLTLLEAPDGTTDSEGAPKQFLGAEVRSKDTLTYGRVVARAKLAKGSAVVSSLVTIYTPWPADNWNELDIEFLGADTSEVQFNTMVYTGPPTTPPVTASVKPTDDPEKVDLGFDPGADFHQYVIEWTPDGAFFVVDGQVKHTWTERIELMNLPQNVLLTIWASSSVSWVGAVDETTAGATAVYDWVELHEYTPPS